MRELTILTISNDAAFLKELQGRLHDQVAAGSRMFVAPTLDEACTLLQSACPHLIIVHWSRDSGRYAPVDRLLWAASVQSRRVPVLVIAERYKTEQATMLYRLGVSEYIGRTQHLDQLGSIISAYLPTAPITVATVESVTSGESTVAVTAAGNAWSATHKSGSLATHAV